MQVTAYRRKMDDATYYYTLIYYPATVQECALSDGTEYEVYISDTYDKRVKVRSEYADKATTKLNGFYEVLVEFVADEFVNGVRSI